MTNDAVRDYYAARNGGDTINGRPVETVKPVVTKKPKKRKKRSAMDEAAEALGLVKVRGALGGIYYE
jgi:hypothetical protein